MKGIRRKERMTASDRKATTFHIYRENEKQLIRFVEYRSNQLFRAVTRSELINEALKLFFDTERKKRRK